MDYALPNALVVDSAAIVFDFNKNVISAVVGANRNVSFVGFTGGLAKFGVFDAVRHGFLFLRLRAAASGGTDELPKRWAIRGAFSILSLPEDLAQY